MKQALQQRCIALFCLLALCMASAGTAQAGIPPGALKSDNPSLAPILEKALPAVVNVVVKTKTRMAMRNPLFQNPFFRRFFDFPFEHSQPAYRVAIGSGVIINADKGYIVTNNHVVKDAEKITVRLSDGRQFQADLIGRDPSTDIAVIQIDAENLTDIPVADSDNLRVGDFVIAIGNPFGLSHTVTSGIVSALDRDSLNGLPYRYENFIQTDASINPGNSGGALINLDGELVGINSAILSRGSGNIGIGFAIPSNLVMQVAHQLIQYGEVKRGRLGVYGQTLTNELAAAFGLEVTSGAVVTRVIKDSPADKAGLQARDVIIAVDGDDIEDFSDLARAIGLRHPGSEVELTIIRNGERMTVSATLGSAAESPAYTPVHGDINEALEGARFGEIPENHPLYGKVQGVAVLKVRRGSPAARAGLRPGDIITSVNRHQVTSLQQFYKLVSKGSDRLLLHIRRQRGALFLLIE